MSDDASGATWFYTDVSFYWGNVYTTGAAGGLYVESKKHVLKRDDVRCSSLCQLFLLFLFILLFFFFSLYLFMLIPCNRLSWTSTVFVVCLAFTYSTK